MKPHIWRIDSCNELSLALFGKSDDTCLELFYYIDMPTPEDHIAGLTKMIAAHEGVKRVILFGSRARGYATARSDIDIAVEVSDDFDWWSLEEAVEVYPTLLKIDLIRFSENGSDLTRSISKTGKILYEAA